MKNVPCFWFSSLLLGILPLLISGCAGSKPSRFYTLNAIETTQDVKNRVVVEEQIVIGLGPVEIPAYLDRPQIVTINNSNELHISEFDRWAGPLREDVGRVLLENLSVLLSDEPVSVISERLGVPLHYRLAVNVTRFDVGTGGDVELKAQWSLVEKDSQQMLVRESGIRELIGGNGYGARVSAMSRAIGKLSREIADEIKTLSLKR
jgi:uncharacterized lipoprotein YmbA